MTHQNIGKNKDTAGIFSFRLPKQGQVDPFFGGARSFWNERVLPTRANGFKPPIKSFVDRKPGASRGIRFILWTSALDYFRRLASEESRPQTGTTTTADDRKKDRL